jgi:hypothetical protein
MAQFSNFDEYMKSSVIDLSPRDTSKKNKNNLNYDFNPIITFLGSKLWLDFMLDSTYFMLNAAHSSCLSFCFDTNLTQHMSKIKEDSDRGYAMACQANCLKKNFRASELVSKAVEIHPYSTRHSAEFAKVQEEVRLFNSSTSKL